MDTTKAITALKETFPSSQILLPGTEPYDKRNQSYLATQESDIEPACIFQPENTKDVSRFIQIIKPTALSGKTAFAIRGAGNMPLPGCSNIQDGITLDLGRLNQVELKDGVVSIGAGTLWNAVDEKVQDAGLAVAGGRSGTSGVGGLALAGGLSVFSSREGFICDNVRNFEVVLASGDVVNASAHENRDLWIALKGGSNNFGVVTRFDFPTFKQGPFWGGNVLYFPASFPGQIEALVAEIQKPDADPNTHLMISTGYSALMGGNMCLNTVYYTQDVQNPAVLEPFTAIQPQVNQPGVPKTLTLTQMASGQAAGVSNQTRCAYMNVTVKADVATLQAATDIYTAAIAPLQSCEGLTCSLTFQPYPVSLLQQSVAKGGNSLGLDPSDGPAVSVLLLTYWKDKSDDEQILTTMKGALEGMRAKAIENGTALEFIYLNYAASFQDPIASYGAKNKQKLQDVSRSYDPDGLFQKGVPGGFKLFT
ncbi:FAD-binding domain-containing protein [Hypoxylon cercidicola]|nr:FAD-binding domain-containing protein [Hypoxylon cercidicola]